MSHCNDQPYLCDSNDDDYDNGDDAEADDDDDDDLGSLGIIQHVTIFTHQGHIKQVSEPSSSVNQPEKRRGIDRSDFFNFGPYNQAGSVRSA